MRPLRTFSVLLALSASVGLGCSAEPQPSEKTTESATSAAPLTAESVVPSATWSRLLRWGSELDQAGFRPGAPELLPEGPTSVAVAPNGEALVLDRLNERVLGVSAGETRVAAVVPADSEEIAVAADGAIAAMSLLRAKVWVYDEKGQHLGEVTVPRSFQRVHGVGLDPSRRVTLRTSYQETHDLGSPSVPSDLPTMLHGKREGAFFLADGRGVQAQKTAEGRAELLVVEPRSDLAADVRESERVAQRVDLGQGFASVRVVGVSGSVVCARLESVTSSPEIQVTRRVRCVDLDNGHTLLDEGLPDPGAYVPRQELAVGAGVVTFMSPSDEGLVVAAWQLDSTLQNGEEVAQ